MHVERHEVDITTASDGAAEEFAGPVSARVLSVHFVPATSDGIVATGELTVQTVVTAQSVWSITTTGTVAAAPRQRVQTSTGAVSAWEPFYVANERLKVTVAGGGAAKSGQVRILTG